MNIKWADLICKFIMEFLNVYSIKDIFGRINYKNSHDSYEQYYLLISVLTLCYQYFLWFISKLFNYHIFLMMPSP